MALTWIEEVQLAAERNTKRRLEETKADKQVLQPGVVVQADAETVKEPVAKVEPKAAK